MSLALRIRGATPSATAATRVATRPMPVAICLVQIALAYEWLVSGLDKLAYPHFAMSLGAMLDSNLRANPYPWYEAFMRAHVMPHVGWCAFLVPRAEIFVGGILLAGAALWWVCPGDRWTTGVACAACAALLMSVAMNITYHLLMGMGLPWIDEHSAFGEGVGLDALLPLIALVLLGANVIAMRGMRRDLPSDTTGGATAPDGVPRQTP